MLRKIRERAEAPLREEALRESEAKFRAVAESIASAIFISGEQRLHYVNHAAEVITGYTREELLSMNFWDLVHPDTGEPARNRGRVHREDIGPASRSEVRILTKNHEERWLDITATTIDFDGEPRRLISAFDLTERKHAEEKVQLLAVTDPARLVVSLIRSRLAIDSLQPPLSASIGVAVYPQDGETIEALLRTADRELYGMKPV